MSKNFNMLELAEVAHSLTEEQKIIKFEAGLKEDKAINIVLIPRVFGIHSLRINRHSTPSIIPVLHS